MIHAWHGCRRQRFTHGMAVGNREIYAWHDYVGYSEIYTLHYVVFVNNATTTVNLPDESLPYNVGI